MVAWQLNQTVLAILMTEEADRNLASYGGAVGWISMTPTSAVRWELSTVVADALAGADTQFMGGWFRPVVIQPHARLPAKGKSPAIRHSSERSTRTFGQATTDRT